MAHFTCFLRFKHFTHTIYSMSDDNTRVQKLLLYSIHIWYFFSLSSWIIRQPRALASAPPRPPPPPPRFRTISLAGSGSGPASPAGTWGRRRRTGNSRRRWTGKPLPFPSGRAARGTASGSQRRRRTCITWSLWNKNPEPCVVPPRISNFNRSCRNSVFHSFYTVCSNKVSSSNICSGSNKSCLCSRNSKSNIHNSKFTWTRRRLMSMLPLPLRGRAPRGGWSRPARRRWSRGSRTASGKRPGGRWRRSASGE